MFFGGLTFKEYMKQRIRKNWRFNRHNKIAPMLPILIPAKKELAQDDMTVAELPDTETIMQVLTVQKDLDCAEEVDLPKTPPSPNGHLSAPLEIMQRPSTDIARIDR